MLLVELDEDPRAWFGKGKKGGAGGGGWDYDTKGNRIGKCGDRKPGEGKPKCLLSKAKAASLRASGGKEAIARAVRRKRRKDLKRIVG